MAKRKNDPTRKGPQEKKCACAYPFRKEAQPKRTERTRPTGAALARAITVLTVHERIAAANARAFARECDTAQAAEHAAWAQEYGSVAKWLAETED